MLSFFTSKRQLHFCSHPNIFFLFPINYNNWKAGEPEVHPSALYVWTIGLKDENLEISGLISSLYNEARKQG